MLLEDALVHVRKCYVTVEHSELQSIAGVLSISARATEDHEQRITRAAADDTLFLVFLGAMRIGCCLSLSKAARPPGGERLMCLVERVILHRYSIFLGPHEEKCGRMGGVG